MHRFVQLLIRASAKTIAFRAETWLWLVLEIIPLFVLLLIWRSIYSTPNSNFGGLDFGGIVLYYLLVFIIETVTAAHFEAWRIEEIRLGKLDFYLTKPLGYLTEIFTRHLGDKITSMVLKLPLLALFFALVNWTFHTPFPQLQLQTMVYVGVFLIGAFVLQFCLSMIVVLLGFWLENAHGLDHFRWLTISLLSGIAIPFSLMPDWLRQIAETLPFKFLHGVPVLTLIGRYQPTWADITYVISCCLVLLALIRGLWYLAKQRYAAYGG